MDNIMENIQLDKNYNIRISQNDIYKDNLDEIVDLIVKTRAENKLTEEETSLLLKIAVNRELRDDLFAFFHGLFGKEQKTEKYTMFMQLKTNYIKHAS